MGSLIDQFDVALPHLPPAMEGLRIAHVTDLHTRRPRRRHRDIVAAIADAKPDMLVLTGDYMSYPGDEAAAVGVMRDIVTAVTPSRGIFGVFGNHDTPAFRHYCRDMPVRWLANECGYVPELSLEILGLDFDAAHRFDSVALLLRARRSRRQQHGRPLRLMLAHSPELLPHASEFGADLTLCGHTHGGQCRLPGARALRNSTDLPLGLTSGMLRHRDTLGLVSRGLGEVHLPLRVLCAPHIPVYRLHKGDMAGAATHHIHNVRPW
ncbi:MAG: metallophosphoesterase [Planctomycetes bacterium]|nr:metallophosphoesterase [Planctomycetota bacterium]